QSPGSFTTLRNLTLNSGAGQVIVPPGTYGTFTANGNSGFVLGLAGATEPAAYQLQGLTLNSMSTLKIIGPVVLTIATGTVINGGGGAEHPEWLVLRIASGGVTLNSGAKLRGIVEAPKGTVTLNAGAVLTGRVASDRLTLNGNSLLDDSAP
ncbi:MAG TPA: hypothetical protein VHF69_14085, partial [Candidatus Synoicihabitans sp.]|nr:hypothetical protein [Candidatus Synoicihabitans sp.]